MKTYTTARGDTWDSIAYKQMGDCKYTNLLIRANQEYLPLLFFNSGIGLIVPDVPVTASQDEGMPVWKRRT